MPPGLNELTRSHRTLSSWRLGRAPGTRSAEETTTQNVNRRNRVKRFSFKLFGSAQIDLAIDDYK